jgi:glycerate 2-kinase
MDPRSDLAGIARSALAAVDPRALVAGSMRIDGGVLRVHAGKTAQDFLLSRFQKIFVLGFGKAASAMAQAAEAVLGSRITKGLAVIKPGHEAPLTRIRQVPGGHPLPDQNSVRAAGLVAGLADEADERTLVIALISGGGSSLLAAPFESEEARLSLADIQETTRQLLACGAEVGEINCIRKHLLMLAGGRLAGRIAPATCIGIVLSDAVGDDLQTIASGPTSADSTTYGQALSIIDSYGIPAALPTTVMEHLRAGAAGRLPETPKPGAPELLRCTNFLAGTNILALRSAAHEAQRLGYNSLILTTHLAGEAREAARVLAGIAKDVASTGLPCPPPACLLAGGETTVTLRGKGKGGRNQELALSFLREMEKEPAQLCSVSFLSFSTDGEDGPTDAAGGFALPAMVEASHAAGLRVTDALRENDSYVFLEKLGGLFITGPTGTNVCDIQVALVASRPGMGEP